MLVALFSGVLLWTAYGVARGDVAIVVANAVTAALVGTLLLVKKKHG